MVTKVCFSPECVAEAVGGGEEGEEDEREGGVGEMGVLAGC